MRRIFGNGRYANVTATVALVVVLGGTSYAAIKLPANSVTSKTVKDKTLLKKDFKPGQLPAGRAGAAGAPGAKGDKGDKGDPGAQGPAGANGTSAGYSALTTASLPFAAGNVTVQSLALPAGKYVISAHTMAHNNTAADVGIKCSLNAGGTEIDSLGPVGSDVPPPPPAADASVNLNGAAALATGGSATLDCTTNPATAATGNYLQRTMTAVQVGSLNGS